MSEEINLTPAPSPQAERGIDRTSYKVGTSAEAFDNVAPRYDADSTYIELSVWFRALVWERMERLFQPGMHVLELGCGTGEDAVWNAKRGLTVTATDASPAMLEETRRKAISAGVAERVHVAPLDFSKLETWALEGQFDGVYSNYGALNCIGEFGALARYLAAHIKPGGAAGLCLIGRYCPWEILWHGAHLHFKTAFRRLSGQTIAHLEGRYFPVYYPTPPQLARMFGKSWQRGRVDGVGVFLPPSDLYRTVGKRPKLARTLLRLEKLTATRWPFRALGDHYWIELFRSTT